MQGLRLFDNDYNQWLTYALEGSFPEILADVFNPFLKEWNVDFRPTETFVFKILYSLFGYNASGYYYFKSLAAALLGAAYFLFLSRYLRSTAVAVACAVFIGLASSTFTSLYWVSDFVIVSELLALVVFWIFLKIDLSENPTRARLIISFVAIFLLTLIADRTKANAKLIPAIIFIYIIVTGAGRLKRYWPLLAVVGVTLVPIAYMLKHPSLPFLSAGGSTVEAHAWQPATSAKLWLLFGKGFEPLSLSYATHPPISILSVLGFPIVYLAIAGFAYLLYKCLTKKSAEECGAFIGNTEAIKKRRVVIFISIWAAVNTLALMSYPTLPDHFQARYAISVLVALLPLLLLIIKTAVEKISRKKLAGAAVVSILVIIQLGFHYGHTVRMRSGMPSFIIALDKTREYIETNYRGKVFYFQNIPAFRYRPGEERNTIVTSLSEPDAVVAARKRGIRPSELYVVMDRDVKDPTLRLIKAFPGRSDSLFGNVYNSGEKPKFKTTLFLYRMNF